MAVRRKSFNWGDWFRTNAFAALGIIGLGLSFYFSTTYTLQRHEQQFAEVNKTFEKFNTTLKTNYDDYAKNQKEESNAREKTREQLMNLFNQLSTNSATTKVQVDAISKQLDAVTNKLDNISHRQLEKGNK